MTVLRRKSVGISEKSNCCAETLFDASFRENKKNARSRDASEKTTWPSSEARQTGEAENGKAQ
jgi:hypothetical protein